VVTQSIYNGWSGQEQQGQS